MENSKNMLPKLRKITKKNKKYHYRLKDPKKKRIVDYGSSRPCGSNMNRFSIHAEQKAIEFCRKNDKRNRYQIYISRYNKKGEHKPTMCCPACKILVNKYQYENK